MRRSAAAGTVPEANRFEPPERQSIVSDGTRKLVTGGAGILILLIALAALLLPIAEGLPARRAIGWMLLAAGLIELLAASALPMHRWTVAAVGGVTALAGARLLLDAYVDFFELLNLIILWLIVRAALLGLTAFRSRDGIGGWLALSAGLDFLLSVALLAGLPVAMLVVGLFGPSQPISATFALVLAISFAGNAAMLLAAAARQSRGAAPAADRAA